MSDGNGTKISFKTITLGNIVSMAMTVGSVLIASLTVLGEIKGNDRVHDQRFSEFERRMTKVEVDRGADGRDIAVKLEDIQRRLARIEGQLERRPP